MPQPLDMVVEDILDAIEQAQSYVESMTLDQYRADRKTQRAVERCLEIISEASRRIPQEIKDRHNQLPWGNIAGIGNVLRHEYQSIANQIIWDTVREHLPPLLQVMQEIAAAVPEGDHDPT